MNRLNIFNYYDDRKKDHEDVLTRNFLILLKSIPAVQIGFFEMVKDKIPQAELPSIAKAELSVAEVYTQLSTGNTVFTGIQDCHVLSIIISDDELNTNHTVDLSDRVARYDGVVLCDPSWLFIIENKPSSKNIWENQLNPNCNDVNGNSLISSPCCLSWRDIIELLNNILVKSISTDLERLMIDNFFEYVNETYSWLNPYNTFKQCKDITWLINKRCSSVLENCFNREIQHHKGWKDFIDTSDDDQIVKQVALDLVNGKIVLWMYAGETMNAAREMYKKITLTSVRSLINSGYIVQPNFHFSFQSTGIAWFSSNKLLIDDYIQFWQKICSISQLKQVKSEDLLLYYSSLVEKSVIDDNYDELKMKMLSKNYSRYNVCPGILFSFHWDFSKALELDDKGAFVEECKSKIAMIRSSYGI